MYDNSSTKRPGLFSLSTVALAAALVMTSPRALADDNEQPGPVAPTIVTGETVVTNQEAQLPANNLPGTPVPTGPVEIKNAANSAPVSEKVAAYSIPDVPGAFTHKIKFINGNDPKETRVLAADSQGKAVDPSRVRIAYQTGPTGEFFVFFPGTGTLEKVGQWPTVYPGAVPKLPQLTQLFNGADGGAEWLERARQIAVGIAAAVALIAVAIVVLPTAFALSAAAVPLAW